MTTLRTARLLSTFSRLSLAIACIASTFSLASCREEGIDGPVDMTCTDIVTFTGNEGGHATFTFNRVDDSPEIVLTSPSPLNAEGIEAGTRLLIRYIPESNKAYTSGPIKLLGGYSVTQSPVVTTWKEEYDRWDKDKVYVYSAWRSGHYLNMHVRLTYSTDPRIFCLAVAPGTADTPWPDVYLVHVISKDIDYHDRAYYASFDLSELWANPEVEGIRLHVANSNLDKQIFTFPKTL